MAVRQLVPFDLNKQELRNAVIQNLATAPSSPVEGQTYYDTVLKVERFYNGTTWIDKQSGVPDTEASQDITGGMFTGNTVSGITTTYDDGTGKINLTVTDAPLLGGQNSAYHLARANHTGTQSADTIVDGTTNHVFTAADDTKLAGIATGATANSSDATLLARANHTGTQAPSTIQVSATDRLLGRDTASAGPAEELTVGGGIEFTGTGIQTSAFTGDVTKTAGGTALTIPNDTVTNAKAANMGANTIKGNNTGGSADPLDLTIAQVKTMLAYNGTEIVFTPTGNLSSTNVAAALAELETDLTAVINAAIEGRTWKQPVDAVLTTALPNTPTYNSGAGTLTAGANAAFPTVDGVTAVAGQDYLIIGQASTFQNGIYTLTTLGSGGAPWVLTRRADASTATELQDATVMVEAGTTLGGDIYTQTSQTLADLTAAAQTWTKTGDTNTVYTADGSTIELVGNSFRIHASAAGAGLTGGGGSALAVGAGTGITVNANDVAISAGGVTETQLATSVAGGGLTGGGGTALAVGAGTGLTVNANDVAISAGGVTETQLNTSVAGNGLTGGGGTALAVGAGTGVTVTANAVAIDTSVVVRKEMFNVGDGSALFYVLNHSLATRDVIVQVYDNSSPWDTVGVDVERTTTGSVTVRFGVAPTSNQYRVVIQG